MAKVDVVELPDKGDRSPAVLIVDDEILIRLALSEFLRDCGFVVFEANTAAEALATLSSPEFEIDVVLTDLQMPGEMDGLGLARWIRDSLPGIPVLITTGDSAKAEIAHDLCEKAHIIPKPHDMTLVLARVKAAIAGGLSGQP